MTDDLVAKLRDEDSYYRLQEKHWCIDAEELERQRLAAADRIEALSAEKEAAAKEERAAIVAWLRRHKVGIAPIRVIETLTISQSQSVLTDAIEAGEYRK